MLKELRLLKAKEVDHFFETHQYFHRYLLRANPLAGPTVFCTTAEKHVLLFWASQAIGSGCFLWRS
jgi:hypothetical protein